MAAVLLGGLALAVAWHLRTRPLRRFRKAVLAELQQIEADHAETRATQATLQAVSGLLRRAAMSAQPRNEGAGQVGREWLQHLDTLGNTNRFTAGPGQVLVSQLYAENAEVRMEPLFDLVREWAHSVKL